MSSSDPAGRLQDILVDIDRIRRHTKGMTADQFRSDEKTQDAVERCFERIAEATRKLGDRLDAKYPAVEFHKLRQLGSVLRHDYDSVDDAMIWAAITRRLDVLERPVVRNSISLLNRPSRRSGRWRPWSGRGRRGRRRPT